MQLSLPEPDAQARAISQQLQERIREEIRQQGGWIPFSRYMELCLYTPGLGYYSAGLNKFGPEGDFITAPELGPLFARTLARVFRHRLQLLGGGVIVELGGGSGRFAADTLEALEQLDSLPEAWLMLERSADLRERQESTLRQQVPHLLPRVQWLDELPDNLPLGIVYGNEVLDALPVERFRLASEGVEQGGITLAGERLQEQFVPASDDHARLFRQRVGSQAPGYTSEICTRLPQWMQSFSQILRQGYWLFSDYGYPRAAYYHPQRRQGTLQCHYRHRAHDDVLFWPGLQDITAHVDFDAVAEACEQSGLTVDWIRYQGAFLLENGLLEQAQEVLSAGRQDTTSLRLANEIKQLTLAGEMGERFLFLQASRGAE